MHGATGEEWRPGGQNAGISGRSESNATVPVGSIVQQNCSPSSLLFARDGQAEATVEQKDCNRCPCQVVESVDNSGTTEERSSRTEEQKSSRRIAGKRHGTNGVCRGTEAATRPLPLAQLQPASRNT